MTKKLLFIFTSILFFTIFKSTDIKAKEYCNFFENNEFKETVELPFYFYEITLTADTSTSMPTLIPKYTSTYIDSLTKCESIDVISKKSLNNHANLLTVYDYSKAPYSSSLTFDKIYENAKFTNNNASIKGYSKILDEEPPYFEGYKDSYTTNIDNPISLNLLISIISAYDNRDGNITKKIKIEYNEYESNLDKIGIYPIILSVEDSANNKTSITFYIEIKDTTPPTIKGQNIYTSYLSSPLTIESIKNNLTAIDNTNTDLTSQIYICEDNYSMNKNKIGLYNIYFCVYDLSNNSSSPYKTVIEVKDDIPPTIEGLDNYTSKLSSPLSIKEIIYSLAASDNGIDISDNIFISNDYYSTYLNTLGEKFIYFQVMDSSNNISKPFKVTINLIDDVPPQIFGIDTYTSNLSSPLSLTYLKQQLTILDNFDGNISNNLEVLEDTYSNNINKKGTYHITFQAKDNSNNISETFKISITNIDDISPTITGPGNLTYSINNKPSLNNLLSEYIISDNIDQKLEIEVINDTYSNSLSTGTFYIELSTTDSSNNKSLPFIIKIDVVEVILNLNKLSLYLPTSTILTIEEINSLINLQETYTILENTYTPNYLYEGTYKIQYKLEDNSKIVLTITTFTPKEIKTVNKQQKKETFITKIKSFFKKIINQIKKFFKKIKLLYIFLKP